MQIYFFLGPEEGRKKQEYQNIKERFFRTNLHSPSFQEYKIFLGKETYLSFLSELQHGSLWVTHRCFLIYQAEYLDKLPQQALKELFMLQSESTLLCFFTEAYTLSGLERFSQYYTKKVFWPLFEREQEGWIREFFHAHQRKITQEAIHHLVNHWGGRTEDLELGLSLIVEELPLGLVTQEQLFPYVFHEKKETPLTLLDHLLQADFSQVLLTLHVLRAQGMGYVETLHQLLYHIHTLLEYKKALEQYSPQETRKKLKLSYAKAQLLTSHATSYSFDFLTEILELVKTYLSSFKERDTVIQSFIVYHLLQKITKKLTLHHLKKRK